MEYYQVIILAGGLGTRLLPITQTIPKVLMPVAGRPFILWQLDLLKENKVDEVILCVGFHGQQVQDVVGTNYRGLPIKYSYERSDKLLGTGGALKNAEKLLQPVFGVLNGDTMVLMNYRDVLACHQKSGLQVTMVVWKNQNCCGNSNAKLSKDGKRVVEYDKGKTGKYFDYIDYGYLVFNKEVIVKRMQEGIPLGLDKIQRDLSSESQMAAYEVFERFYEIGSMASLAETEEYLLKQTGKRTACL